MALLSRNTASRATTRASVRTPTRSALRGNKLSGPLGQAFPRKSKAGRGILTGLAGMAAARPAASTIESDKMAMLVGKQNELFDSFVKNQRQQNDLLTQIIKEVKSGKLNGENQKSWLETAFDWLQYAEILKNIRDLTKSRAIQGVLAKLGQSALSALGTGTIVSAGAVIAGLGAVAAASFGILKLAEQMFPEEDTNTRQQDLNGNDGNVSLEILTDDFNAFGIKKGDIITSEEFRIRAFGAQSGSPAITKEQWIDPNSGTLKTLISNRAVKIVSAGASPAVSTPAPPAPEATPEAAPPAPGATGAASGAATGAAPGAPPPAPGAATGAAGAATGAVPGAPPPAPGAATGAANATPVASPQAPGPNATPAASAPGAGQITELPTGRAGFPAIVEIARRMGDPFPEVTAAQWALESGWGKSVSGKYNYFGQKARAGEQGSSVMTTEVLNGQTVRMRDRFKDYNSPEESIADHIKRWSPKYANAKSREEAAAMLKAAGYATDPGYVAKLVSIMNSNAGPSTQQTAQQATAGALSGATPPEMPIAAVQPGPALAGSQLAARSASNDRAEISASGRLTAVVAQPPQMMQQMQRAAMQSTIKSSSKGERSLQEILEEMAA